MELLGCLLGIGAAVAALWASIQAVLWVLAFLEMIDHDAGKKG